MKELKVILSPHFSEEEFLEEVSGIVFQKGTGATMYAISIEDNRLSGIQSALRKNILIPFDKATNEFVNGNNITHEEPVKVEVQEPVVEAAQVVEEVPSKKTRKRATKKDTE